MQINPKQEFVKAIMSVLRLEPNIYTTGAIETLIERLRVNDYQMFIAYLGERKADYEKPIENIAKGVDEFYHKKLEPHEAEARKIENEILNGLAEFKNYMKSQSDKKIDNQHIIDLVEENYGKQDESTKEYQIQYRTNRLSWERVEKRIIDLSTPEKKEELNTFLKMMQRIKDKERVFNDKHIQIINEIGFAKIMTSDDYYSNNIIFDHIFTKNVKPNIQQQIVIKEYEKIYEPELLSEKTRLLLNRKPTKEKRYEEVLL